MSDIFICYSRTDSTVASRLAERLRAEGWSVFIDVQTHVGCRWHKEIEKELLHAAKAVVVLWSARSRRQRFRAGRSPVRQTQGDPFPYVHRARGISLWIWPDSDGRSNRMGGRKDAGLAAARVAEGAPE